MFKLSKKLAAGLFIVTAVAFAGAPVLAASEGQIEGGDIFRVQNTTKNVGYADPASADACNVLEYKFDIENPGSGEISPVMVQVNLPSGASTSNVATLTASATNADPSSTTDTATVNLSSSQSISYVNGTTQELDANGNVTANLPDGITQGGINIGAVQAGTANRVYVQFEAQVSCPTPPTPPTPVTYTATETASATANASANCAKGDTESVADASASASASASATSTVSQADANQQALTAAQAKAQAQAQASANAAASAKCAPAPATTTSVQTSTPAALPNTGPGDVEAMFVGTSSLGAVGNFLFRRFRR